MYRADFLSSKVFHVRFGVLNGHTVELYKGDHMLLENTFALAEATISSVQAVDCDVKPQGVNMLKGYFDGVIESKCLVRHVASLHMCSAEPLTPCPTSMQACSISSSSESAGLKIYYITSSFSALTHSRMLFSGMIRYLRPFGLEFNPTITIPHLGTGHLQGRYGLSPTYSTSEAEGLAICDKDTA